MPRGSNPKLLDWCAVTPSEVLDSARDLLRRDAATIRNQIEVGWAEYCTKIDDSVKLRFACAMCAESANVVDAVRTMPDLGIVTGGDAKFWRNVLSPLLTALVVNETWFGCVRAFMEGPTTFEGWRQVERDAVADPRMDWGPWSGPSLKIGWEWARQRHFDLCRALRKAGVPLAADDDGHATVSVEEMLARPGVLLSALNRVCEWTPTVADVNRLLAQIARDSARCGRSAPDQLAERHTVKGGAVPIQRPDFYVTTDIRATSDPLWRNLAAIRRRLMEGVAQSPAEWQSQLFDIRLAAHAAGLRPSLGSVEYIVATVSEARDGGTGLLDEEEESWSKVILTACGEAGWIQLHDLLDGFADTGIPADKHKRESAIEWAESWMNARERQLAQPAAVSLSSDLLERLQLAAASVDTGAIDRAAERAAERVARVLGGGDNAEAKPPALHAGVVLTADHESVLAVLGKTPTRCRTVIDVSSAGTIRNRETVGRLLRELAGFGMVDRPHGKQKGYALTDAGRKRLRG